MTTQFDRPINGYRFAEVLRGDSLQSIALRELGDATQWPLLITYNRLVPPFISQNPADKADGVVIPGELILVPAPTVVVETSTNPDEVFERDVAMVRGGQLATENGDFAVSSGTSNLLQAIRNRIASDRGELLFHPEYGSGLRRLIGEVNTAAASLLAAQYARLAVETDPRIERVVKSVAAPSGDKIEVSVEAETIAGRTVSLTITP